MSETVGVRRDRAKRPKLGGDIITILVGPDATATRFYVHADLVTQHSEFFEAALKNGWKEAEERVVRLPDLPDDSAKVFEDFHSFLYTGKVFSSHEGEVNEPGLDWEWARLEDSWVLGQVLLSTTFKDAVTDALIQKMTATEEVPLQTYEGIYSHGSEASSIRKLMVDIAVHKWEEQYVLDIKTDDDSAVKAKFLQDVTMALLKWKNSSDAAEQAESLFKPEDNCLYHEHGTEKPCYKTMFG